MKQTIIGWVAKNGNIEDITLNQYMDDDWPFELNGPEIYLTKGTINDWGTEQWPPQKIKIILEVETSKEKE